jgi:hypothetical protein
MSAGHGLSILREENGMRVFDNRKLWGIFGPKREEITGLSRLHNELNNLYFSLNIIVIQ